MPRTVPAALLLLIGPLLAGCVSTEDAVDATADAGPQPTAPTPYEVRAPDTSLALLEHAEVVPMPGSEVEIHVRVVRPDRPEPVPVIVEFTPYTAPGRAMAIEPVVLPPAGTFVREFVRRGFAFAYADVRGTGDSSGCLDLRGSLDIADAWNLTEWLGTQPWANGKVGFLGASYPGSEAHIAGIAGNPHLGGVIPVVASTSFYLYQHKGGVPYSNHVGTNTGYNVDAATPTVNPQYGNWATRQVREAADCDQERQLAMQFNLTGTYDDWWKDRNLRWRVGEVQVPVLMAQGLADWNVKPDHIATYWNDLATAKKTLIAGQWPHRFPMDSGDTYGKWWELATAFFDETLNGIHTGLFDRNLAYVQGTDKEWYVYDGAWPPLDANELALNLRDDGLSFAEPPKGTIGWNARPYRDDQPLVRPDEQVVLESEPLAEALHVSGTPRLDLTLTSSAPNVHVVAVLEADTGNPTLPIQSRWTRENYGYLNPIYRDGIDDPQPLTPGTPTPVTIEFYPQEDVIPAGTTLRLILRSVDDGRTVPVFDEARIEVALDGERPAVLWLPLSTLREP